MQDFEPDRLEEITGGVWQGQLPAVIRGFAFDARMLNEGECFVALSGGARDGHEFVGQAASAGASALLVERAVEVELPQLVVSDTLDALAKIGRLRRDEFAGPVVGVTGSSGKTSTKEMLRLLLGGEIVHATPGNWNNRIGVPMTLFGLDARDHEFAVVEAGINQPGEMAELGQMIHSDITVLTNIGTAHLELLESQNGIAEEKAKLASFAKGESPIILTADSLRYESIASMAGRCVALAAEGESLPVRPSQVFRYRQTLVNEANAMRVELRREDSNEFEYSFDVATTSSGMAQNASLAFIVALELGLAASFLPARLAEWQPGETRGNFAMIGGVFVYADCYNANPNSMVDALQAFERVAPDALPRTYVLGAMNELGVGAEDLHAATAQQIKLRAEDRAIFVGPENLVAAYHEGALSAGLSCEQLAQVQSADSIKSDIARMEGALFLKGSRGIALESLIPASDA